MDIFSQINGGEIKVFFTLMVILYGHLRIGIDSFKFAITVSVACLAAINLCNTNCEDAKWHLR